MKFKKQNWKINQSSVSPQASSRHCNSSQDMMSRAHKCTSAGCFVFRKHCSMLFAQLEIRSVQRTDPTVPEGRRRAVTLMHRYRRGNIISARQHKLTTKSVSKHCGNALRSSYH